ARPTGMVLHRDASGFMNYSLTADGRGTFSGSGELGASLRGNLAFSGFSVLPDHSFVRGLSYLVVADPSEMRRIQLGDAIGFSSPYYAASGVLADGISEYGYHLGFRRLGFGQESIHYGPPELLARHRIGIGDRVTAGFRLESAMQRTGSTSLLASGGPNLALA